MFYGLPVAQGAALLMLLVTLWLMRARFTHSTDWNFPIAYYLMLVLFARTFEGEFVNEYIFAGAACAMFIRFEFLGKIPLRIVRVVEFLVHAYVVVICAGLTLR